MTFLFPESVNCSRNLSMTLSSSSAEHYVRASNYLSTFLSLLERFMIFFFSILYI
jgi:hypothetical protein